MFVKITHAVVSSCISQLLRRMTPLCRNESISMLRFRPGELGNVEIAFGVGKEEDWSRVDRIIIERLVRLEEKSHRHAEEEV